MHHPHVANDHAHPNNQSDVHFQTHSLALPLDAHTSVTKYLNMTH